MAEIKVREGESGRITVAFLYNPTYVARIKDRRWHPAEKYWSVPFSDSVIKKLLSLFAGEKIDIAPFLQTSLPKRQPHSQILQAAEKELKLGGYNPKTRKTRLSYLNHFMDYLREDPVPHTYSKWAQTCGIFRNSWVENYRNLYACE